MHPMLKSVLTFICVVLGLSVQVRADVIISNAGQPRLIELYTSEGCSSCPPADRWLSRLQDHPGLWTTVIPVAFHVDYWNDIGWYDRFSSNRYSMRQRHYAANQRLDSVYTPGFVINGQEWRGFFKRQRLPEQHGAAAMGELQVTINNGRFSARYTPQQQNSGDELVFNIAILGFDMETRVDAGENRNRKLTHDFVVLGHKAMLLSTEQGVYRVMDNLPDTIETSSRTAVAAWIQHGRNPAPLQSAGGWLQ